MKTKRYLHLLGVSLLLMWLLAACGAPAATPEPTAASIPPTEEPTAAPEDPGDSTADEGSTAGGVRTFVVVPAESRAAYIVNEEFFSEALSKLGIEAGKTIVVGATSGVTGEIQLNLDSAEPVENAQFSVDMTGLQTDQDRRDDWLRDNAIETGRFPQATFTASAVTGLPDSINEGEEISFQLVGDLTVRDVTRSVTFDVTAVLAGDTLQGTANLPLKLTDFGIDPPDFANTLKVADDFSIEVSLTARER